MGLTSLWSNITGPKVKEITPQPQCSWLEKNRPKTSGSTRKKIAHLQLKHDEIGHTRPTTSHEGKRKKHSLSVSRPKLLEQSKKDRESTGSGARGSSNVPDVPALPEALSPGHKLPPEDITRPGTARTTDGSVSTTTEVFELPGDGLPSPRLQSPQPSPLSPTYPTSPKSYMTARSQEPADIPGESGSGLRKRSNSTASGKPKQKHASWFMGSCRKAAEAELPPPLPPPLGPPPKPPLIQSIFTQVSNTRPSLGRRNSSADVVVHTPVHAAAKNSLDSDSILNAFPSVPVLAKDTTKASEANTRTFATTSTRAMTSQATTFEDDTTSERQSPLLPSAASLRSRPIAVPTQTIDGLLSREIAKETPRHDSKQLPTLPADATTRQKNGDSKALSFSEELQLEYDRLMEVMGEQPYPEAVLRVVGKGDGTTHDVDDVQKFSNDEALAKLEFGILK